MTTETIEPNSKPKATSPKKQLPQTVGIPAGMPFKQPPRSKKIKKSSTVSVSSSKISSSKFSEKKPSTSQADVLRSKTEAASSEGGSSPKEPSSKLTELQRLVRDVKAKVPGSRGLLKDYIAKRPGTFEKFGDLAGHARRMLADLAAGDDPILAASFLLNSEKLSDKYKEDRDVCPTEEILIEQIVICRLRLDFYDTQSVAYAVGDNPRLVKVMQGRHESAQSQLYRALNQLERFRKLKAEA